MQPGAAGEITIMLRGCATVQNIIKDSAQLPGLGFRESVGQRAPRRATLGSGQKGAESRVCAHQDVIRARRDSNPYGSVFQIAGELIRIGEPSGVQPADLVPFCGFHSPLAVQRQASFVAADHSVSVRGEQVRHEMSGNR